ITIEDSWSPQETATGVEVTISKGEIFSLNIVQAPEEPTKAQIHGESDLGEFSSWGEFYGSTSKSTDTMTGQTIHSWLLYNGNYVLFAQYIGENPKSLNLVKKAMSTLKRVAP